MKVNKIKLDEKVFRILLILICIIIGATIFLLLFSTTELAIRKNMALWSIIISGISIVYIFPLLGLIFIDLVIMYIIKAIKYKEKKTQKIIQLIVIFAFFIISLISSVYSFINYAFNNTYEIKINSRISEVDNSFVRENLIKELKNEDVYVKRIILQSKFLSSYETIYYKEDGISKSKKSYIDDNDYLALKEKALDLTKITQYYYKISATTVIVLTILLCTNAIKQYRLFSKNEDDISKKDNVKLLIILGVCTIGIILITVVIKDYEKNRNYTNLEENYQNNTETNQNISNDDTLKTSDTQIYDLRENTSFKIELSNLWRDRYTVEIYKTTNNGKNWNKVDSNLNEVYIGSEFMFLNEEIGFVHDPYGGIDSYDIVKITTDGGENWNELNIDKPEKITEENIFFRELPTKSGERLEIIAYTVNPAKSQIYNYYKFESNDLGKSWSFVKEVSYSEILKMDRENNN